MESRLVRCERLLFVQGLVLLFVLAAFIVSCATTARQVAPGPLRVTELVVVDPQGVERVRIGGDLPDAIIGGKRAPRGQKAAGVLLYDARGSERSGYVTWEPSGNVGLTLDTQRGQVALLVADRESGSAFQLWHGRDVIELRSDEDGSRLSAVRAGQLVVQQPEVATMTAGTCAAYQEARSRVSLEQVRQDCRRRFNESACSQCLSDQP